MKWLFVILFSLLFFVLSATSEAQLRTPPSSAEAQYLFHNNRLKDPGAEIALSATNWVQSAAGTFSRTTASGEFYDTAGFKFDATAAAQTVRSNQWCIPTGASRDALNFGRFKTTATDYLLNVYDGTNVVSSTTIPATSEFTALVPSGFTAAAGSCYQFELRSQSNAAALFMDTAYLGDRFNISFVSQSKIVVATHTDVCSDTFTNTTVAFSTDASCSGVTINEAQVGTWATTDFDGPRLRCTSCPAGIYIPVFMPGFIRNDTANVESIATVYVDGDVASPVSYNRNFPGAFYFAKSFEGYYKTTVPKTNLDFEIRVTTGSTGTGTLQFGGNPGTWKIYYYPLSADLALNQSQTPMYATAYHDNNCRFEQTSATFADTTTDATCTFTTRTSSNLTLASAESAGNKLPGITFTPAKTGTIQVCARGSAANGTSSTYNNFRLYDGTTVLEAAAGFRNTNSAFGQQLPFVLCGNVSVLQGAAKTIKVQNLTDGGTLIVEAPGFTGNTAIEWSVLDISQSFPAPLLIGSVTSKYSGSVRLAFLEFGGASNDSNCTSNPCTIRNSSGDASSVTRGAVGQYSVTWSANTWSADPVCTCISVKHGSNARVCSYDGNTTSSLSVILRDSSFTADDGEVQVMCTGPR